MALLIEFLKTNAFLLAIPYAFVVFWLVTVAKKSREVFAAEMSHLPDEVRAYRGWALTEDETQVVLCHRSLARFILWGKPPEVDLTPLPEEQLLKFRIAYAMIILPAPIIFSLYAPNLSVMHVIAVLFVALILIWRPWPWDTPPQ